MVKEIQQEKHMKAGLGASTRHASARFLAGPTPNLPTENLPTKIA